jgi:hypothetical protein
MPPTGPAAAGTCPVSAVIDAIVTTAPATSEAIHPGFTWRGFMWSSFPCGRPAAFVGDATESGGAGLTSR